MAMEFFETWLPALARNDTQLRALTEAILRYGREIDSAAAAIYASAASRAVPGIRGWRHWLSTRWSAGTAGPELLSRAAALSWESDAPATVIVGAPCRSRMYRFRCRFI